MNTLWSMIERLIVAVIAILFITPLSLTIVCSYVKEPPPWANWLQHNWVRNASLAGVQIEQTTASFSWPAIVGGKYQQSFASQFDRGFAGRECLIRLTNEAYFRLFRTPSTKSSVIVLGHDDWVYESYYLREYCIERPLRNRFEPFVLNLVRLQEACQHLGVAFAVIITPSKASIYPEQIPPAWQHRYDARPRAYDHLVKLFQENGVRYVDGHALTAQAKGQSEAPLFPKGGIHWGQDAALFSTDALIATLQAQGKTLRPIEYTERHVSDVPAGVEGDVYTLMNLAVPWRYPFIELTIKPMKIKESGRLTLAVIGGSFMWPVLNQLSASQQFSEIDAYFYYTLYKTCFVNGESKQVASPVTSVDFGREIFAADCLVLEVNEAAMINPQHLLRFLTDALKQLALETQGKQPFLYESLMRYQWGQELSFQRAASNLMNQKYLSGFSGIERESTWTDGPEATLRLTVPPPKRDLALEAEVGAMIFGRRKEQRTKIYVNDELAGEWVLSSADLAKHQVIIPKKLVGDDGKLVLRFEIIDPPSPQELGLGADNRKLGLRFSKIQLHLAGNAAQPALTEKFMPYQWGQEISFLGAASNLPDQKYLSGFSGYEEGGTWTDGPEAILRLSVPQPERDLMLEAEVGAMIVGTQKVQRTKIYVNDEMAGEWVLSSLDLANHQLIIPRKLIGDDGKLLLRFEIIEPSSPQELGMGADTRKLGLRFSKLRVRLSGSVK